MSRTYRRKGQRPGDWVYKERIGGYFRARHSWIPMEERKKKDNIFHRDWPHADGRRYWYVPSGYVRELNRAYRVKESAETHRLFTTEDYDRPMYRLLKKSKGWYW